MLGFRRSQSYSNILGASEVAPVAKNPEANIADVGDAGSIPGSGRCPGGGHGNPLQYSLPGESQEQRSLAGIQSMGSQRVRHDWATNTRLNLVKNLSAMHEMQVQPLGLEDPLEKDMVTHSSILPWRIPWMEEPGGIQSMRLRRAGHDWASTHAHTQTTSWEG